MSEDNKTTRVLVAMAAFLGALLASADSYALQGNFHNGSLGSCDGCHGKKNAQTATSSPFMLKGADISSTCLACHESSAGSMSQAQHHVATNLNAETTPLQQTPGGDFSWLKKDYRWTTTADRGEVTQGVSLGERHGHNIVASEYGYQADRKNAVAPGGSYPAEALSCASCHDPHGDYKRSLTGIYVDRSASTSGSGSYATSPLPDAKQPVGVYRLLAGKGYQERSVGNAAPFTADPPAAVAPETYNRSEQYTDTRVAYGAGMSEWCRNCHPGIHAGNGGMGHPAGNGARLSAEAAATYNAYIASGNLNGSPATAYSSLVPFETGSDDYQSLRNSANSDGANRHGVDGSAQVMCLSCHRAHASGWDSMTRWNTQAEFIVKNGNFPGTDNYGAEHAQGRTSQETRKAYYGRSASAFATFQRSLCNKCHAKD